MTKNEILTFLREKKYYLQNNYGVTSIGLLGSYARDEVRKDSDIDIAVELQSKNKFMNFFNLKYYLEEHLHTFIDIGIESTLKSIVKEYIGKDIIYA